MSRVTSSPRQQDLVTIVDYELGNLFSLKKALERIGSKVHITGDKNELIAAQCLVLPGVGAFQVGVENLKKRQIFSVIQEKVSRGTPILGICLGMQLLFQESSEHGHCEGLNLLTGRVRCISDLDPSTRVPQIGWNKVQKQNDHLRNQNLSFSDSSEMYFLHSYIADGVMEDNVAGVTSYGSISFPSVVVKERIVGCQFHPEKSGAAGLRFLESFLKLTCER
jgi:glutamine amidotransferase